VRGKVQEGMFVFEYCLMSWNEMRDVTFLDCEDGDFDGLGAGW